MILIKYTELKEPDSPDPVEKHLFQLPAVFHPKVRSFKFPRDAQLNLFGKLLLRRAAREIGWDRDILTGFGYTRYDRPFVEGYLDFNTSHSGDCVVVAMCDNGRVGVDIEAVRNVPVADFHDFFTAAEMKDILEAEPSAPRFFHWWTCKEALMKADGRGLNIDPRHIRVENRTGFVGGRKWHLTSLSLAPGYVTHLASEWPLNPSDIQLEKVEFA